MVNFCKTGGLILRDCEGELHYFDSACTLSEIAKYVFNRNALREFRVDDDSIRHGNKKFIYVDSGVEKPHRLRRLSSRYEDAYYREDM